MQITLTIDMEDLIEEIQEIAPDVYANLEEIVLDYSC